MSQYISFNEHRGQGVYKDRYGNVIPTMPCVSCGSDCGQCGGPSKSELQMHTDGVLREIIMEWDGHHWRKVSIRKDQPK